MTGLFLQGGGAKGAFQAGVIQALTDAGVRFDVVAGTSIGAINGYFVFAGRVDQLPYLWKDIDVSALSYIREEDRYIENAKVIDVLREIPCDQPDVKHFYVNYVRVETSRLREVYEDLTPMTFNERMERIRYSSLLPKPKGLILSPETMEQFDTKQLFEQFQADVVKGEYDGMSMDGGIVNNHFLQPFMENRVDRLVLIPFMPNYVVPDYIQEVYEPDQLLIIDPVEKFLPLDTLRFERAFCKRMYDRGYERAKEILAQPHAEQFLSSRL